MSIEVHRAGRTFYAHTTVLLNIPHSQLDSFFNLPEWSAVAAAKVFRLPEVTNRPLYDFVPTAGAAASQQPFTLSAVEAQKLRDSGFSDAQIEQFREMQAQLYATRAEAQQESSPSSIARVLEQRTGVPWLTWQRAGQEMLDAVIPTESGRPKELFDQMSLPSEAQIASRMGLSRLVLCARNADRVRGEEKSANSVTAVEANPPRIYCAQY